MELVTFDRSLETLQGPIGRAIDGSRSAAFIGDLSSGYTPYRCYAQELAL